MNLLVTVTFLTQVAALRHAGTFWLNGLVAIGAWLSSIGWCLTTGESLEQIETHWRSGEKSRQL